MPDNDIVTITRNTKEINGVCVGSGASLGDISGVKIVRVVVGPFDGFFFGLLIKLCQSDILDINIDKETYP